MNVFSTSIIIFERPSYVDNGKEANPNAEAMSGLPMHQKFKDDILHRLWIEKGVEYRNPQHIFQCAMGMDPDNQEKKVVYEWAATQSRRWKEWIQEEYEPQCRGCNNPDYECQCLCNCYTRDCFCAYYDPHPKECPGKSCEYCNRRRR